MDRMTLHEAQTKVANIVRREGWSDPEIDWSNPIGVALSAHVECLSAPPLTRKSIAWREIRSALIAYHAHLVYSAGCAAEQAKILAYAESADMPLDEFVKDVRAGLHYAEAHQ